MSTTTTSAPAANKLFTSSSFRKAKQQAAESGMVLFEQSTRSITSETPLTVVEFRPATNNSTNWQGLPILGYLQLEQVRTITIDTRTQEDRMAGSGAEKVRVYTKRMVAFQMVTSEVMAKKAAGTVFGKEFYIAEAICYVPVYPGHNGIVTSDQVVRYAEHFICERTTANPERMADVLMLDAEAAAVLRGPGKRTALFELIRTRQFADGSLTQDAIEKALAAYANNKPDAAAAQPSANSAAQTNSALPASTEFPNN